jgi:membrane protein implicated in regulation of membrane protease activity
MGFFISRSWRLPKIIYFLMVFELPFTVANLALFGIASPNLYRTILWRVGGELGFNSKPSTVLYAAANYRPVDTPLVWSSFNTQYHLVIGVVCMFFWLVKVTLWLLKVFFPILSLLLHIALMTLWAYGIHIQTAPDTIDPKHTNNGAPWYITKSCNIVDDKHIKSYCMQAKSSFAVSIIMLAIYAVFVVLSVYSLIPTTAQKQAHAARKAEKKAEKEKWASSPYDNEMTAEEQWQHMWELQQLPRTPGTIGGMKSPMTPRTQAFNNLGGEEAGHGGYYSNVPTGGNAWYGPPQMHEGTITVSPVMEQDEYYSSHEGKGKAPGWGGNAY